MRSSQPVSWSRSRQLLVLAIVVCAGTYAQFTIGPLQDPMRLALALSDNELALLQGPALFLPVVIAFVPLGIVINRHSRVALLFIFSFASLAGSVLTALASGFTLLFAARCLLTLAATATFTTALSMVADLYGLAQRGRASMVVMLGQMGGTSLAFALGGALLAKLWSGPSSWTSVMLWLTVPLVPATSLLLVMREPPRTEVVIQNPSASEALIELWRYRSVIAPLLGGAVMISTANAAALIWSSPALSRSFEISPARLGAIMAMILLASGVPSTMAGGLLADCCQRAGGSRRTMLILSGLALLNVPAGFFAVAPGVISATATLALFMTVGGVINVTVTALCTVVVPNELRALCVGVLTVACGIPNAFAPVTVSLLSAAIGGPAMIGRALAATCVLISLLGAAALALGSRYYAPAMRAVTYASGVSR